jgi:hypothetical protein
MLTELLLQPQCKRTAPVPGDHGAAADEGVRDDVLQHGTEVCALFPISGEEDHGILRKRRADNRERKLTPTQVFRRLHQRLYLQSRLHEGRNLRQPVRAEVRQDLRTARPAIRRGERCYDAGSDGRKINSFYYLAFMRYENISRCTVMGPRELWAQVYFTTYLLYSLSAALKR